MKTWHRGTLKEDLFELKRGTTVVLVESNLQHTSINRTYWIVSPEHKKAYHVADTYAGVDCKYLVRVERKAKDEQLCVDLARRCCMNGQFGPKNRHTILDLLNRGAT
jgi:hypothetical protein